MRLGIKAAFAVVLMSAATSFATPAVGDAAKFSVTITQNGAAINGTYEMNLVSLDSAGNFVLRSIVTLEGQPANSMEESVAKSDLLSDDQINQVVANCQDLGGTPSTATIQSANIATCVMPLADNSGQPSGEIHVGAVPFGVLKQVQINNSVGRTTVLELVSFTAGK